MSGWMSDLIHTISPHGSCQIHAEVNDFGHELESLWLLNEDLACDQVSHEKKLCGNR
jgi:hypothetical protein